MERSRGEGLHDTQLTTLDGGRDLHGSPPLVAQVTGWGLVPVGREVAKFIPELDDSPLGWKANSHVSSEESSEASGPWTGRTPAGREDPGWRGGGPQLVKPLLFYFPFCLSSLSFVLWDLCSFLRPPLSHLLEEAEFSWAWCSQSPGLWVTGRPRASPSQ